MACFNSMLVLGVHIIIKYSSGDSKVFYLKMKGDYHRYLAEFKTSAERKEAAESTLTTYKASQVSSFIPTLIILKPTTFSTFMHSC